MAGRNDFFLVSACPVRHEVRCTGFPSEMPDPCNTKFLAPGQSQFQRCGNLDIRSISGYNRPSESSNIREAGGLNFLACDACRRLEKTEALLCCDVELAVAPGLGKNERP
jgi:hypothetical protein